MASSTPTRPATDATVVHTLNVRAPAPELPYRESGAAQLAAIIALAKAAVGKVG